MSRLIILFLSLTVFSGSSEAGIREFIDQANESAKSAQEVIASPLNLITSLWGTPTPKPKLIRKITAEVEDGSEIITIVRAPGFQMTRPQVTRPRNVQSSPAILPQPAQPKVVPPVVQGPPLQTQNMPWQAPLGQSLAFVNGLNNRLTGGLSQALSG